MSDDDLVQRLRAAPSRIGGGALLYRAADRIEQLQAQLAAEQKGCEQAMQDAADWRDDNARLTAAVAAAADIIDSWHQWHNVTHKPSAHPPLGSPEHRPEHGTCGGCEWLAAHAAARLTQSTLDSA
jgi:hypothetical protein